MLYISDMYEYKWRRNMLYISDMYEYEWRRNTLYISDMYEYNVLWMACPPLVSKGGSCE